LLWLLWLLKQTNAPLVSFRIQIDPQSLRLVEGALALLANINAIRAICKLEDMSVKHMLLQARFSSMQAFLVVVAIVSVRLIPIVVRGKYQCAGRAVILEALAYRHHV